jgi:hypothetical protein
MRGFISRSAIPAILLSSILTFGCSSDDDGGSPGASVPANAVVITEANAYETVVSAIGIGSTLVDAVPVVVDITPSPSYREIIEFVVDKAKNAGGSSDISVSIPTGIEETYPCSGGGDITINSTDTDTSSSGTVVINNCIESGITLNGSLTFNFTYNLETYAYTDSIQGNISGNLGEQTFSLTGLVLNETGNEMSGDYSINTYTYSVDSSVGGGFLVELLAAIVGNHNVYGCPSSGIILVTGANNTQAKATINSDNTVTVEYNDGSGTFTEVTTPPPGSPYPCEDFFIYI